MKSTEILSLDIGEKVYVTELYQDCIAVGLKSTVLIYQINFESESPSSHLLKAVSRALEKSKPKLFRGLKLF